MTIRITNSLTKKKEEFNHPKDQPVTMYACGVTVYDRCHIGHARSLYVFDVIRRYLESPWGGGYQVHFVRNITDVDDKIIARANETGRDWKDVVDENIRLYHEDMKALGITPTNPEPRATENIPGMIAHIEGLIKNGTAYASGGNVYFDVRKFKTYGKLSGQSVEHMLDAVRIDKDEDKRDPLDFALWKKSREGEPFWDSPWGKGRPGWHIECSCMSMKHLGTPTLDIHAGGRDLIFPHHENEIAQSEALTGKPFAKLWIHHGLLTINGQKMAKSLGNFITIEDVLKKYSANALKLLFLQSHYGSPVDFTWEKMEEANKNLETIDIFLQKLRKLNRKSVKEFLADRNKEFIAGMDDDFNTPKSLAALFDTIREGNRLMEKGDAGTLHELENMKADLDAILDVLGITFAETALPPEAKKLLNARGEARKNKDFKKSDELRDQLKTHGVLVEDTKDGQTWRRI